MYGRACIVHIVISHLHHGGGYYYEKSRETFRVLTTRFFHQSYRLHDAHACNIFGVFECNIMGKTYDA